MFLYKLFALILAIFTISEFFVANVECGLRPPSSSSERGSSSGTQNDDPISELSNLNIDLQKEFIKNIPLVDLPAVWATNTDLKKVACEVFKKFFHSTVYARNGSIYLNNINSMDDINLNCFSKFVQIIFTREGDLRLFTPNRFPALKEIRFFRDELTNIDYAKNVLPNVEHLHFGSCKLNGDLRKTFLKHCGNLQRLYVRDLDQRQSIIIGTSNEWLSKQYRSLKHFDFDSNRQFDEVINFLNLNPQIHTFSTNIDFLLENRHSLLISGIKLDVLGILESYCDMNSEKREMYLNLLEELHRKEFFNYLQIRSHEEILDYPDTLIRCIKTLEIAMGSDYYHRLPLDNLKQLYLWSIKHFVNVAALMPKIQNLEYVSFFKEKIVNILPFIKCLPKLSKLQIQFLEDMKNVLDLPAINNERAKLVNATKLTLFIPENFYFATKKSFNQEYNFIEIQRFYSFNKFHYR